MKNNNLTEVVVILDRSGSMSTLWGDVTGSLDHFVNEQRKIPGQCKYTLVVFDSQSTDVLHNAEDIHTIPSFPTHIHPRGGTPLIDAMGQTINSFIERFDTTPEHEQPGGVIFAIITDGQENQSRVFKKADVVSTIQERTNQHDWKFIYLSSDINAFADASDYNFDAHNTVNLSNTGQAYVKSMNFMSDYATSYRGASLDRKAELSLSHFVAPDEDLKMQVDPVEPKDTQSETK